MFEWRRRKRREWRAVAKALDVFQTGCAYTPVYPVIDTVISLVNAQTEKLRGNWEPS